MKLIECRKSRYHGFYRENEDCPWCPPAPQRKPIRDHMRVRVRQTFIDTHHQKVSFRHDLSVLAGPCGGKRFSVFPGENIDVVQAEHEATWIAEELDNPNLPFERVVVLSDYLYSKTEVFSWGWEQ